MRRWLCGLLLGHRWRILAVNERKHVNLVHLHTMAGCLAVCDRCSEEWDDLGSLPNTFGDDVTWIAPRDLPRATALP